MRKSLVVTLATALVTATFVGGMYVGRTVREPAETVNAESTEADSVGEWIPQATNPDGSLPITDDTETAVDDYINRVSDADAVQVVPCNELTTEMLENRNGKIYVEKMVGIVDDDEGNGHILNPYVDGYNYIMYGGHVDFHKGDIVVTYNVYNPEDNAIDDIIARSDYVVGNVNE